MKQQYALDVFLYYITHYIVTENGLISETLKAIGLTVNQHKTVIIENDV